MIEHKIITYDHIRLKAFFKKIHEYTLSRAHLERNQSLFKCLNVHVSVINPLLGTRKLKRVQKCDQRNIQGNRQFTKVG